MKKVQELRQRAADCRRHAAKADNPEIRGHYQSLAEIWDRLADERIAYFISPSEENEREKAGLPA